MKLTKIISGGQRGAERGALDAARQFGIPHGGWCPKNRLAEDGRIPDGYALQELPTPSYLAAIKFNVMSSDATLVFTPFGDDVIAHRAIEMAVRFNKPYLQILLSKVKGDNLGQYIAKWLTRRRKIKMQDVSMSWPPAKCVLNVTGDKEIHALVARTLVEVFGLVKGEPFILPFSPDTVEADNARASRGSDNQAETPQEIDAVAVYDPSTMDEAVDTVLGVLSDHVKAEMLLYRTASELEEAAHFGLALWIRNSMIRSNPNRRLLLADYCGRAIDDSQIDDFRIEFAGAEILSRVWDRLRADAAEF